ncbi:MAG: deoxyribonuclease IV [candidate division WOR-3 bacterium]|nr:deoxyribonuclease IV [candidate division WOR-3 bacterium]
MRFGFHISIAGGFRKVVDRALKKHCQTIQLFSRNPRGWEYPPLDKDDIKEFQQKIAEANLSPIYVHMPYLPNLATPDKELFKKSLSSLITELERTETLSAQFLIMHIGSRMSSSETEALKRVCDGINQALNKVKNSIILLLENTSGMGSEIGYNFIQIKTILDNLDDKNRLGVVIDTAHIFEAGYPIHTKSGLDKTLREFDELIGLKRLYLLHLNDSKTDLGSRIDRHWHIGEGKIGLDGFKNIVNHPLLKHLPGIMETPRTNDKEDLKNMKVITALVKG